MTKDEDYTIQNTDRFLFVYRKMEAIEKNEPERFNSFMKWYQSDFDLYRSIRNNLTHNTFKGSYPVAVSTEVLLSLLRMVDRMNWKCLNVAVKRSSLIVARATSKMASVIKIMSDKNISHIPIFDENDLMIGVISEAALIDIMASSKPVNDTSIVSDFASYFRVQNNPNETYLFLRKNAYLYEARRLFENRYSDGKRLGVIFLTDTGKQEEKVLGLLAAVDALKDPV